MIYPLIPDPTNCFYKKLSSKKYPVQKIIEDSFFVQSLFPKMVQDFVYASFGFYNMWEMNQDLSMSNPAFRWDSD